MDLHLATGSTDTTTLADEGRSPRDAFSIRSSHNFGPKVEGDLWLRYVGGLSSFQDMGFDTDSYYALDARIAWKPKKDLEVSLVGQNLLQSTHLEFGPDIMGTLPTQVERGAYGKVTWKF
jgi:iron complex outermembrane receptor protein